MLMPPQTRVRPDNLERPIAAAPARHTLLEDIYAILTGCGLAVLGLIWLKAAGLVTGGVAGLALLLSYMVPLPAGVLFALLNIPFFLVARRSMGRSAMIRSIVANLLISGLAIAAPYAFRFEDVNGPFAALAGGTVIGVGLLLLARHQVGVGGLGIIALALQKSRGWNPGRTQLIGDALILAAAVPVIGMGPTQAALSVLSSAAVAGVLIVFHRPGRYTGY
jgi:uncharacterized membrane-anchored protein YitT (DUF2179 family)